MKYAVQVGVGVMIYIPSFAMIGSGIIRSEYTDAETQRRSHQPTLGKEIKIVVAHQSSSMQALRNCRRVE
jgi:hypothetical protein